MFIVYKSCSRELSYFKQVGHRTAPKTGVLYLCVDSCGDLLPKNVLNEVSVTLSWSLGLPGSESDHPRDNAYEDEGEW